MGNAATMDEEVLEQAVKYSLAVFLVVFGVLVLFALVQAL